ncbi:MAG: orotate phosphoribosyltransferase [Acidobacteriota bacterium]|nr:orotate phosphoribosyltransferase [Acidobacteriota bacterium]
MDSVGVLELFRQSEALLEGHFELSSGLHSAGYLQCARVLQYPERSQKLGQALAAKAAGLEPTVVLSPALGGVVLGHEVARALGVRALFAERRDERLLLRRGFQIVSDERVLIVEDVVTTGLSTRETIGVATAAGGNVIGATALIDRGEAPAEFALPFEVLVRFPLPTHRPEACPMCVCGEPVIKPGSRQEAIG